LVNISILDDLKSSSFASLLCFLIFICLSYIEINAQETYDEKYYSSLEWRNIGPWRGGRSCAVTGVKGKPNLFYFGATGGGIWKTTDGGRSWDNISDGFFGGSIGSIHVNDSDPNVIYAGGGEKTVRGNVSFGYGLWKSEDAGKNWTFKGLSKSRHISRIRSHPNNPDIVYAAVMGNLFASSEERGIYKSIDGGQHWKQVLFANKDAGAVDLIMDPNNPRILFASTWKIRRTPYSLSSGGDGSALWKSTDAGETWTNISTNKGLPDGAWGISGVCISPQNSERVWAIIENEKGGVFRSDDGGENWQRLNEDRALRQRAWYYTRIYADTEDEDKVYVVNVAYHLSKDGGKTFKSSYAPHGDHHDLWIDPNNSDRMIIGDDGGAQVTYDGGETWTTYHNQATSQFYRVTVDNHFPYRIYAAQQDNSTIRISHRSPGNSIDEDDWERTAGGESAHIAIDPLNNDIVYGGSYGGFLSRVDHSTNQIRAINVWPDNPMGHGAEGMKYRFQWNFPIFFSKHDSKKLYTCSNHVHVSTDEGQSWDIISPDLTRNDPEKLGPSGGPITKDNTGVEYYCTIFSAQESSLAEGLIWVGTDDGLVHLTRDGGSNWQNVTPPNMPEWMMINSIEPDPHNEGGCYIAGTLYKAGDFKPYIYKTSDYGKSWRKIVTGIDEEHFTRVIRADPVKKGILYAGTETGMYISFNDGRNWQAFQLNLPIVPITDLVIKDNNLIAATQGRSLYIIDDLTVLHQQSEFSNNPTFHLYKPLPSWRLKGSQNKNVKGRGLNHPGGVMIHYYLDSYDDKKDSLSLTIKTLEGDTIQNFSNHTEKKALKIEPKTGANLFVWNMRYSDAKDFEGMIFWWGSKLGPKAVPGNYQLELMLNGKGQTKEFEIIADPRNGLTQEQMQNQFDFISSVNDKVSEAHETIIQIRNLKNQMKIYSSRFEESDTVKQEIRRVDSLMTDIEKTLYQVKNKSNQDPLNFPIRLTNKLAHLNSLVQIGDDPPTQQMIQVRDELSAAIDDELEKYRLLKEKDIPTINAMIQTRQLDAIWLEE
jgi:photosystem II stability/assembly factor-like uncharacterized protein